MSTTEPPKAVPFTPEDEQALAETQKVLDQVKADTAPAPEPVPLKELDRIGLRNLMLDAKPVTHRIPFRGAVLEIREPTLDVMLNLQAQETDQKTMAVTMITNYAYAPGSSERLFDDADIPALLNMPFTPEVQGLLTKVYEMMGVQVTEADKSGTPQE